MKKKYIYFIAGIIIISFLVILLSNDKKVYPYNQNSVIAIDINKNNKIDKIPHQKTKAWFDFNGNDLANNTEWIDEDYILVFDLNMDNKITYGKEFFYDPKISKIGMLTKLDSNKDGIINDKDAAHKYLKIWNDKNRNGMINNKEILEFNVLEIYLEKQKIKIAEDEYIFRDTPLVASDRFTKYALPISVDQITIKIILLPYLRGYGSVYDSNVSYLLNEDFKDFTQVLYKRPAEDIENEFDLYIKKWTGLEDIHNKYGIVRDKLDIQDKTWIMDSFVGSMISKGDIEKAWENKKKIDFKINESYVEDKYEILKNTYLARFFIQSIYKDTIKGAYFRVSNDKMNILKQDEVNKSILDYINSNNDEVKITRFIKTLAYLNHSESFFKESLINQVASDKKALVLNTYTFYKDKR